MSIDDDKRIIRELVESWALWRDARLWDRFRTIWHADGRMMATWFQGSFEEFIKANDQGWARCEIVIFVCAIARLPETSMALPPRKCRMRTPRAQP